MKNLKSVLEDSFLGMDQKFYKQKLLEDMNEFFDNEIPSHIREKLEKEDFVDYILENL